jgi:hypothetical protein
MIAVGSWFVLGWMVRRKVDGGIGLRGLMVDAKLESMAESVYCKVQVYNNIIKFSGRGEM